MIDDDVLILLEVGREYTREEVEQLADVATSKERTFVIRALGRLKRWGKIKKTDKGLYVATGETKANLSPEGKQSSPKAAPPSKSVVVKAPEEPKESTTKLSLNDALLKFEAMVNGAGVDDLENKLYVLNFMGRLLDPTIDEVFKSIASDLKRLNGRQVKG